MGDKELGLYKKYIVERTDGSSQEGRRHYNCEYFVLDLTHDKHAIPAIKAYINSVREDGYEELAKDLESRIK